MHNLGSFDGFFIYKYLSNYTKPTNISSIIDNHNKFIEISYKNDIKLIWRDSMRIFDVSLNELCYTFNVEGKTSKYNQEFNKITLFDNLDLLETFKEYSIQDSISLYKALNKAQSIYYQIYSVDITSIHSTASLSMKIFRTNFLDVDIPTLKNNVDNFVRHGYFGGGTDYYKSYFKNAKIYDVNSLYPNAMCKPMPYEIIKHYNDMSNIELNNFFGFCLAEIYCPRNMIRPVLPYKLNGKTIYPTGT